jgi:ketosteroid isomerase-like protein
VHDGHCLMVVLGDAARRSEAAVWPCLPNRSCAACAKEDIPWLSMDRLLIRERLGAYGDASSRADVDAWLACWTEDGVRAQAGVEVAGKAALRAMWDKVWGLLDRMAFFSELGALEVRGERATARCYCREIMVLKGGGLWKVVGVYDDLLVRQDGVWLFARRDYQLFIDEGRGEAG